MSSVGTPPGVPAGNFASTTNTNPARQIGGTAPDDAARTANARCTPSADTALQKGYGSGPQLSAIAQNRPIFSQTTPPSAESLNALQRELELLSQRLSQILDSSSYAPASSAPQAARSASAPAAAQHSNATTATDSPYPNLGPRPFMSNPTGTGPTGSFGFNPQYFPTEQTATKIADMLGGKVVPQVAILNGPGSPFKQNQVNYMVELPNGRTINPGFIAQAISSGQPRNTIDAIIYSEVTGNGVQPGEAPPFVPVNRPAQSPTTPPAVTSPIAPSAAGPAKIAPQTWFHMDPMQRDTGSLLLNTSSQSDPAILALGNQLDQARKMLQIVSQLSSVRSPASDSQTLQSRPAQVA
jgi:hypothetical protein